MKSRKPSAVAARVAQYAVLCLGAFFTLLPFLWMISSSLKTPAEIVRIPPVMIPETAQFSNYAEAWAAAPFGRYLINTVIVTILTTAGVLVTSVARYPASSPGSHKSACCTEENSTSA